ncbi:MAG: alpha/beta hydrolase [Chloroflexia bacterium]|nr:alpha/beta hydrolase [Chloroflexia bacterium]
MSSKRLRVPWGGSTSRRTALRLGASGLAVGVAGRALPAAAAQAEPGTFVLVPGQWTGAFIWHRVTPLLRAAGHEVYEVTCTGLGDRVHLASPTIDMDTHITDVVNTIEFADLHDVVLVGHSYSGMIITGVAERVPERLRMLVYLDASVPTDGQNSYDADFIDETAKQEAIAADLADGMAAGMPGFRPVTPGIEEWVRDMVTDPAEAEWFISRLVPHPLLSDQQPVKLGNPLAAALPRAFILCTADKDLDADPQMDPYVLHVERVRSDPLWRVIEMNDNHVVNLNDPQGTAEAFMSLL